MHELGIASEVLEIALSEAGKRNATKVTAVKLRVGVLRGIVPEHMVFLFGQIARGTIAEGASLEVEQEAVAVDCEACGRVEAASFALERPACGRGGVRLSGGDSLRFAAIEMEV